MASNSVPLLQFRGESNSSDSTVISKAIEITWNLILIIVSVVMLFSTLEEYPTTPIRLWISVYTIQCLFHFVFVCCRIGNLCKFINTMISFIWWIFGVHWLAVGGHLLMHNAPRLYWLVVALLTFRVFTAVLSLIICILRSKKEIVAESDHSVDVEKLAYRHAPLSQSMLNNYSQHTCNNAYWSVSRKDNSSSLVPSTSVSRRDNSSSLAPSTSVSKWSDFRLSNVTLELHDAKSSYKLRKDKNLKDDKPFVAFEIDSIPEKRPFRLSRDFVFVRPSDKNVEPFQGILYRVVRSTVVLVEFKNDFHSQHRPQCEYDVSFSFNRVCLKRCHKAIETVATNSSLNFLFPKPMTKSNYVMPSYLIAKAFRCRLRGDPPYLIEGPQSTTSGKLSPTGKFIRDMVFAILDDSQKSRILVCTPLNNTCDVLTRSLRLKIPESDLFRANAAFREFDDVPDDILSSSSYEGECFTCPSLEDLSNFKVIISTFISSFRLNNKGLSSGHFTHIIMVDASTATEPETMVTLANFAGEETGILVTGTHRNFPGWVRSDIGRKYGLQISYFNRLFEMEPYSNLHSNLIMGVAEN